MLHRVSGDRPTGCLAGDLTSQPSHRRGRGHPTGEGEGIRDEGGNSSGNSSSTNGNDSEENLDHAHGRGGPVSDDPDVTRRWSDGRDGAAIDWGMDNWSRRFGVRDNAGALLPEARVDFDAGEGDSSSHASSSAADAHGAPILNDKEAHAADIVVQYSRQLDDCRAVHGVRQQIRDDGVTEEVAIPAAPDPIGMVLTGTAGTGKTVVTRELVHSIGRVRFLLLTPNGNAARGIGGQV